jgi:hypothetical protein
MKKKAKPYKAPRPMSLVKLNPKLPKEQYNAYETLLGHKTDFLLFLGEIPNMCGHSIVLDTTMMKTYNLHTDNFVEMTEDEI